MKKIFLNISQLAKTLLASTLPLRTAGVGLLLIVAGAGLTSCLSTDSELVEFEEDNHLSSPTDSVYSVLGIVNRMQLIADRSVLLGEVRSDLVSTTEAASADLKRLANFDFSQPNKYNQVADYYAVINNCNFFLTHVDTTLQRRGRTLFTYEYAAVKAFRAWAYLELVKNYGEVPLVTVPLMTEREAQAAANGERADIKQVCDYFIADLTPYALVELPTYGNIGNHNSTYFFIPMRALLGDLCLWAGRYKEAARWYNAYLNDKMRPVRLNYNSRISWSSVTEFQRPSDAYTTRTTNEYLSYIPMEQRVFDGTVSDLPNIFGSTRENNYYYQLVPSQGMKRLSAEQVYCMEYKTETTTDTLYAPRTGLQEEILVGDLRLYSNYSLNTIGGQDEYSELNSMRQTISKVASQQIITYRTAMVYLRYAEALNRAGLPQSAMCVLKHGICQDNIRTYVDSLEQEAAGDLITFDPTVFTHETTLGIHSRGSGDSHCNAFYVLPQPESKLATRQDTIDYQIPLVEKMIVDEMALEGAFEGYRYHDLLRVALRRGDPAFLATPIANRTGIFDESLYSRLMNKDNWFMPLQ